ncbi:hypothetical protein [Paludibacterium yongneupense]|uniref:hypothetical protein n=1 Tax=Paludibacterium yongneupense TaxID=400061 RepID=UPI0003F7CAC5|nr:hypothetical protein [Paludibacterium yongneupense]
MILLYADDPGAANYLSPLPAALQAQGLQSEFWIDPALGSYCADRGIVARIRGSNESAEDMLVGKMAAVLGSSEDADCFGHRLTSLARRRQIPTLGVVDMCVNAENRFRGGSRDALKHVPDWLVLPDVYCRDAFFKLGFPSDRMLVYGHPHYDHIRARKRGFDEQGRAALRREHFPDAPSGRQIWMFLAEGVDRLDPACSYRSEAYTLHGRGDTDFRAAIVLEEVIDVAAGMTPRPWIVLRPHPKSDLSDFDVCAAGIDEFRTGGDPLPLLCASDRVIGMTTMLLLEAYLLGCPALSVLPRECEREWLATLKSGLTPVAQTREQLGDLLSGSSASHSWREYSELDVLPVGAAGRIARFLSAL